MTGITRDAVQGFIDGLKAANNDLSTLPDLLTTWLENHPVYPQDDDSIAKVISDIGSYRT